MELEEADEEVHGHPRAVAPPPPPPSSIVKDQVNIHNIQKETEKFPCLLFHFPIMD